MRQVTKRSLLSTFFQNTLKAYPCGSDHTPSPMASRDAMEATAVWQTSAARLTAVAVSVREGHSIAFLGDARGNLHKVVDLGDDGDSSRLPLRRLMRVIQMCCNRGSLGAPPDDASVRTHSSVCFSESSYRETKSTVPHKNTTFTLSCCFFYICLICCLFFSTSSPPPYTAVCKIPLIPAPSVFQHPQSSIPQ